MKRLLHEHALVNCGTGIDAASTSASRARDARCDYALARRA